VHNQVERINKPSPSSLACKSLIYKEKDLESIVGDVCVFYTQQTRHASRKISARGRVLFYLLIIRLYETSHAIRLLALILPQHVAESFSKSDTSE
jgi:hypothetical protein